MKVLARGYISLIYALLYIPIIVLMIYSFNSSKYSMVWHGFSLRWYHELFGNTNLLNSAWHSLVLGVCAASLSTVIGVITAVSLYRYRFFGKNLLNITLFLLILLPDIVIGISLLILYSYFNIQLGFLTLLIGHITLCMPFIAMIIYSRLSTYSHNIIEAAIDLGASNLIIFKKIILPLLVPGIIAAFLLSFTLSFDDVIISYFVSGPSFQILPLQIYSMVKFGVSPQVNALSTIILMFTLFLVACSQLAFRKRI